MNRQPPGIGTIRKVFSSNGHSSSSIGSRLMARRTGCGSGVVGSGGGGTGAIRPRIAVVAADRLVIDAPQAAQLVPPWLTVSQTPHVHSGGLIAAFSHRASPAACPATRRPDSAGPSGVDRRSPRCQRRRVAGCGMLDRWDRRPGATPCRAGRNRPLPVGSGMEPWSASGRGPRLRRELMASRVHQG
jgi:hypothetical protein